MSLRYLDGEWFYLIPYTGWETQHFSTYKEAVEARENGQLEWARAWSGLGG
jgi:transposase-like protein